MSKVELYTCVTQTEAKMIVGLLQKNGIVSELKLDSVKNRWLLLSEKKNEGKAREILFTKSIYRQPPKIEAEQVKKSPLVFLKIWKAIYLSLFGIAILLALFEIIRRLVQQRSNIL